MIVLPDPPTRWWRSDDANGRPEDSPQRQSLQVTRAMALLGNYAQAVGIPPDAFPFPQVKRHLDRAAHWQRLKGDGRALAIEAARVAAERALASPRPDVDGLGAYVAELT